MCSTERITLQEPKRVVFTRIAGSVLGTIANEIEGDDNDLRLRFSFALVIPDVEPGSAEEDAYAEGMKSEYLKAVSIDNRHSEADDWHADRLALIEFALPGMIDCGGRASRPPQIANHVEVPGSRCWRVIRIPAANNRIHAPSAPRADLMAT